MRSLRIAPAALLASFLAAAPAGGFQADGGPDFRGKLSLGAGSAHGLVGLNAEGGRGHWAGYLGLGFGNGLPVSGVAAGARWFGGLGDGPMLSLGLAYVVIENQDWLRGAIADWNTGPVASARFGWRLRLGWFTAEVGAGPALVRRQSTPAAATRWAASIDFDVGLGFEL